MTAEALLSLRGVSAYYGRLCALRGIDLDVRPGESVAIIGPNGAGKSTLLRAISGVMDRVTGTMRFDGSDCPRLSPQARVAGGLIHVPEGRQVFADMTVEENIRIGAYTARRIPPALLSETISMFPRLEERRHQLAGTLSGGEQQMLAMARALMGRPKLLMLDEPSMGLAPKVVAEIYRQIAVLRERGVTILLVEQNARLALAHADRALILATGAIRQQGEVAELARDGSLADVVFGS